MKNLTGARALWFIAAITVTCLLHSACNNSQPKPIDIRTEAEKQVQLNTDSLNKVADAKFLSSAAELYLEEIKLGELALKKGKSADVRALGHMMSIAHTNSMKDLTALALKKNITIPTQPGKTTEEAYLLMNNKPACEFDKEYCHKMESAHNKAIALFEEASENGTDADIKKMAGAMLTDFDTHLYHIVACLDKLEAKTK